MTILHLKNKLFKDSSGNLVLVQKPNIYICVWAVARGVEYLIDSEKIENVLWWTGSIALFVWALLELAQGVNYFRKALGLIILVVTIISIFKELI